MPRATPGVDVGRAQLWRGYEALKLQRLIPGDGSIHSPTYLVRTVAHRVMLAPDCKEAQAPPPSVEIGSECQADGWG